MRKKVNKSQQSAYLVRVWTKHHAYAPKNRDELVSFVKTLDPNFSCSTIASGDAQSQLKEYFALSTPTIPAQADKDFDEIKNDPIFSSVFLFCKDLQNQFEQAHKNSQECATIFFEHRVHELEKQLEKALKLLDEHGIKYDPEYFKTNGTLKAEAKELVSKATEAESAKQVDQSPEITGQVQDEQSGKSDQLVSTDEVNQDVVLAPEQMQGAKEALEAINKAKEAKLKQPKSKAKNVAKVAKVKLGKEEPNENSSPLALTNEVKQSSADEALINDLSLLVEDVEEPKEATETAEQPSKVASFNGSGEDKTRMDAKYHTMSKRKS